MASDRPVDEPAVTASGTRGRPSSRLFAAVVLLLVAGVTGFVVLGQGGGATGSGASAPPGASVMPAVGGRASPSETDSLPRASPPVRLPGARGLIAIVDQEGALVTVDGNGGSRVSYDVPGVTLGFPAWSPDGSRIAAIGQTATETRIYIFPVGGHDGGSTAPTIIYRSPDRRPFYLYWTPDGRRVSFLTNEPAGLALRLAPIDGSGPPGGDGPAGVIWRGSPLYFDWLSQDRVLLHVGLDSQSFTGEVSPGGGVLAAPLVATGSFRPASVSHDGRYVAYASSTANPTGSTSPAGEIVVARPDGSGRHTMPAFGPAAMLFDPAGDALATIAADRPGSASNAVPLGPLRLLDPTSGTVRTLLDGPVIACFWAPDGKTIAALRVAGPTQGPAAAAGRIELAEARIPSGAPGGATAAPGAAGTGVSLAFVNVATGAIRSQRVVQLSDPFVVELLPYFDQYGLSHRLWSPDSTSLVLPLVDDAGREQIVAIPADGSDLTVLAPGAIAFVSP